MNDMEPLMEYSRETWYDKKTRCWVTQVRDARGNQIGDAFYDGNRASRDASISEVDRFIEAEKGRQQKK